jgi:hypothetical protein
MIEAAKVIVPIGEGREVEARASTHGLEAQTEPYAEDGQDEVLVWTEEEANLFEESLLVEVIGEAPYSEVQVFVPNSQVELSKAKMQELGVPTARRLSESEWTAGATYETRY